MPFVSNMMRALFALFLFFCFCSAQAFDESVLPSERDGNLKAHTGNMPVSMMPKVFQGVSVKENLGKELDLNLNFTNQNGETVSIGQMLNGKPLILTLNYYTCKTLCSLQIINLAKAIKEMKWPVGKDYNIATISFDPKDTPKLSQEWQKEYVAMSAQVPSDWKKNDGWNFFTGSSQNIETLTKALGYFYKYDPDSKEFAHAAVIFVISPEGKISRYLYGVSFIPRDIKFALMDASANKIGSSAEQLLLTCFHYNPTSGKYDAVAIGFLKLAAGLTLIIVFVVLFFYFRRDKKKYFDSQK